MHKYYKYEKKNDFAMSFEDIGTLLGMEKQNVERLCKRAMEKLSKILLQDKKAKETIKDFAEVLWWD